MDFDKLFTNARQVIRTKGMTEAEHLGMRLAKAEKSGLIEWLNKRTTGVVDIGDVLKLPVADVRAVLAAFNDRGRQ